MVLPHRLSKGEKASIIYHSFFDYSLNGKDLIRWVAGPKTVSEIKITKVKLPKENSNKKFSEKKIKIARKAASVLSKIENIKLVAITGSLAMDNAKENSDIDLMIITKKGTLWTTRLLSYFWLRLSNLPLRKTGDKNEKDKLCLNMWLDEGDLSIQKRNAFMAHEIAQIIPLVNKNKCYERFLWENKWLLDFWPKSVSIKNYELRIKNRHIIHNSLFIIHAIERFAYWLQYFYMRPKITREIVTATRAFFHPLDGSAYVEKKLRNITLQKKR
ncbi:MAG: nucleotidyltransferase domain-containing protein [Patescibacteria group bacterium]